jgi:hypothetical protein
MGDFSIVLFVIGIFFAAMTGQGAADDQVLRAVISPRIP